MSGELKSVLNDGPIEGETLVSVCVITYNHGKYIRQCLDGILMQKVNFPYEILIHDDASPDETADIIREYWEKYPTVIKPILREENQYSKGVDVSRFNFDRSCGKYIALCEGDDYWTDDGKLQLQVDFLERHEKYVECGHNVLVLTEMGFQKNHNCANTDERIYTQQDIINGHSWKIATCSIVFRNVFRTLTNDKIERYYALNTNGDFKLRLLCSEYGDCYIFREQMGVYRYITQYGSSWCAQNYGRNLAWFTYESYHCASDFMKREYDIDINLKPCLDNCLYQSILCIMQPHIFKNSKDNIKIFIKISKEYSKMFGFVPWVYSLSINTPKIFVHNIIRRLGRSESF